MGKSFLKKAPSQKGTVPACTGALIVIKEMERLKTKPKEGKKQKRMYHATYSILEPKSLKGMQMHDYYVIGTEEDPLAKEQDTWERSEGGPGRLARLFEKCGIEIDDSDDQLWMDALVEGEATVVAPIVVRPDRESGEPRANLGLFYAPDDDDVPDIGLAEEEEGAKKGKKKPGKRAAAEDEEEDEAPKKKKRAKDEDEEEEEEEDEKPKKKGKKKVAEDEEEDEDEDEKPRKKKKTRKADEDE